MSKIAVLFAGQGAQTVGMGLDLAEQFPTAKALFDQANQILGYDLARICFDGPDSELTKTENAQPGIFLVSWIALQVLRERLPTFTFQGAAGLSLGEFTALAAAGAMSFEDGLKLVHQRGRFMQEACDLTSGTMAAVIGLEEAPLREVCAETGVEIANINCPGQIVVSGPRDQLTRACELAKEKGAKRTLPLTVAGAYHSQLMISAQAKLRGVLESVRIQAPSVPVISNVTGQPHTDPAQITDLLVKQVTSTVRWEESMRYLLQQGFDCFIELGPGTALSGFMKRIDSTVRALHVADRPSLKSTIQGLTS